MNIQRDLLRIALDVRSTANRSYPRDDQSQAADIETLKRALRAWEYRGPKTLRFDSAVQELLAAAIAEAEA